MPIIWRGSWKILPGTFYTGTSLLCTRVHCWTPSFQKHQQALKRKMWPSAWWIMASTLLPWVSRFQAPSWLNHRKRRQRWIDRFCEAMISIYQEKKAIEIKLIRLIICWTEFTHTQAVICADEWNHVGRLEAAFPFAYVTSGNKFWPSIARINTFGDRNLCLHLWAYQQFCWVNK